MDILIISNVYQSLDQLQHELVHAVIIWGCILTEDPVLSGPILGCILGAAAARRRRARSNDTVTTVELIIPVVMGILS